MMDMSYDAGAGGWGEGGGTQTTSAPVQNKQNAMERLPVCVTVADLTTIPEGEECVAMGGLTFTNVRVAGIVSAVTATEDNGQSIEYSLKDVHNPDAEFTVINYIGLSPEAARDAHQFPEGTKVHAVGKLRSFGGRLVVVAFQVREIEENAELEAFELESKIGHHFFENHLYDGTPGQDFARYDNTILSNHIRSTANRQANTTYGAPPAKRPRPSGAEASTDPDKKGLTGQKLRIFQYIVNNSEPEVGVDIREVKKALNGDSKFDADIAFLTDEGHVYNTHDDDHYAPI
ncbi:hypothetical protein QR680_012760 [Steinernema hermaphroditum]|uniref:Replication protein A C-terminal domain-containing protein n=1 Tax=Steinernema hermaphroditum TaxID=289476 RepID=A0AA39I4Q3_9BILA|nr:hypothetical protein QR680_012760 [Steinernema hermaphroditum]